MSEIPHPDDVWGYICRNRACKLFNQNIAFGGDSEKVLAFYIKGNCPHCKTKSIESYETLLTNSEVNLEKLRDGKEISKPKDTKKIAKSITPPFRPVRKCIKCGKENRIDFDKGNIEKAICGNCKTKLNVSSDTKDNDEFDILQIFYLTAIFCGLAVTFNAISDGKNILISLIAGVFLGPVYAFFLCVFGSLLMFITHGVFDDGKRHMSSRGFPSYIAWAWGIFCGILVLYLSHVWVLFIPLFN